MNQYTNNQLENIIDAFLAEKYFNHYRWLNYIDSPYNDPELAQRAEKVLDTTRTNDIRARYVQKPKKKSNKEIYPKASPNVSPRNTPEPDRPTKPGAESSQDASDADIKQSSIYLARKQAAKQPYTKEKEEAWLSLFHAKLRVAIENGSAIKLPSAMHITEAMNNLFTSNNASHGHTRLAPRTVTSVRGKLVRTWGQERKQLKALLRLRTCIVVYVPSITVQELEAYRRERAVADEKSTEGRDECHGQGPAKRDKTQENIWYMVDWW